MRQNNNWKDLDLEDKVDLILTLLTGNPLDRNDDGLQGAFDKLKEEFYKLRNWRDQKVAWALGVVFGGGVLITVLVTLLINALTSKK